MPLYWATIVATLAVYALTSFTSLQGQTLARFSAMADWPSIVIATVANVTFIGLDAGAILCFFKSSGCLPLKQLVVVPQAWTLTLEVMFYAVAPFIARAGVRAIIPIFVIALVTKAAITALGMGTSPLGRQFIGTELVYFMLGMISYGLYRRIEYHMPAPRRLLFLIPVAILLIGWYERQFVSFIFTKPLMIDIVIDPPFYLAFTAMLPFLFHATRYSKLDEAVGELSYPIYITHILALNIAMLALDRMSITDAWARFYFHMMLVFLVAGIAYIAIVMPVERWRGRVIRELRPALAA